MIDKVFFNVTKDEIGEIARLLLREKSNGSLNEYAETRTLGSSELGGDAKQDSRVVYSLIRNEETKAVVYYFPLVGGTTYRVAYFSPEEWGRYTFPFEGVSPMLLYNVLFYHAAFIKPSKPLPAESVGSTYFHRTLEEYFGEEKVGNTEEELRKLTSIEEAFVYADEKDEDTLTFIAWASPEVYAKVTGVEVHDMESFLTAVKKHFNVTAIEEKKEQLIKAIFLLLQQQLFLRWASYEFARTEDYSTLQECIRESKRFLTPIGTNAQIAVLAKYIAYDALHAIGRSDRLRDISEVTKVPFKLLMEASKVKCSELIF